MISVLPIFQVKNIDIVSIKNWYRPITVFRSCTSES